MQKGNQFHVSLDEHFHRRVGSWNVQDITTLVTFCEAFEYYDFDALFCLSSYCMTPSVNDKGQIERIVFEIEFSFGSKMLQITKVAQRVYLLSD